MLPTQSGKQTPQRHKIKIRAANQFINNHNNHFYEQQNNSFSFNQQQHDQSFHPHNRHININMRTDNLNGKQLINIKNQNTMKKYQQKLSLLSVDKNGKSQQGSIFLPDLIRKLQKISYAVLQAQYGQSFTQNSSYFQWITQLKYQQSLQKLLHTYTQTILSIIQQQQRLKLNTRPQHKQITIKPQQKLKLKLILNKQQQQYLNRYKNKGLQTYVKKIQEQGERHKRQYIMIKQRNRILENQLLKSALQFKHKRQLYITQITRLTQILHSSFMEVGKMFVNYSTQNTNIYRNSHYNNNNMHNQAPQPAINKRKNFKSLSPSRKSNNLYNNKQQQKLPDYIKQPAKLISTYQNYAKTGSSYMNAINSNNLVKQNSSQINHLEQQKVINRNRANRFDAESQPERQERYNEQRSPTFNSSTVNGLKRDSL